MAVQGLTHIQFRNRLLNVMAQKNHWAWSDFVGPSISKAQLKIHYQQEYAVYVRDFPVFLARIHGKNPPLTVRKMLAENIFEEDTGQLSLGCSHPQLFITMMQGLGFRAKEFDQIALLPATRRYRKWLDRISDHPDWVVAAAVMTIFVEGSVHDREEISHPARSKSSNKISAKINAHPLVTYHGVKPEAMDLIRAHQMVEGGHRHDAYAMVVNHARSRTQQEQILDTVQKTLNLWLRYRDGVARACKLTPP
jgi:pyrroloquinoline quinone (PQQ) biosynthesis protein C